MSNFDKRYGVGIPLTATMPTALVPLGYQQITATGTAFTLTPPTNARLARIGAEAQVLRWRDDGTAPTATTGQRITAGTEIEYVGNLAAIRLIAETAGAIANVSYYG
ncbi:MULTISPECIES: hypothetical protein [Dyella]|uniref:Head decoration protein n=2 Tax=Dyella TaxID=231454 RepID=A0A4R0YX34_9GAMM|nr:MULTISPECIES: hypothetical protein [Dyella]TBR39271.1 hypothetical protein EYV96_03330 [Dyella terrae]TCI13141.1 hypothetical protein EZM97_07535 [Dyella soli]